jgi:UDP-N-acetylmuramoyl-tripeptide--D-alanyl-D-alanine ligase
VTAAYGIAVAGCLLGQVLSGVRFLRVAQREHYIAGSATRFAWRWWRSSPANLAVFLAGLAGAVASVLNELLGLVTAAACALGPLGLGIKGRSAPLVWTRRMKVLALASALLAGLADAGGFVVRGGVGVAVEALVAIGLPVIVDLAMAATAPFEAMVQRRYAAAASSKLARVRPVVVAITGSYGKTSTKNYVSHLLGGARTVVASPASFNNLAGLSRAVNEGLPVGTEVFVAEMGTYGPGEIAQMCRWIPPDVAVITAVGPVHLERMKSEENILAAKSEICVNAPVVVLNVDDHRLVKLADELEAQGKDVRRATASSVQGLKLPTGVSPTNAACALEVARALGVGEEEAFERLASLPEVDHRRAEQVSPNGVVVIDDTYNSNPAGCRVALAMLCASGSPTGRKVVVTPGMVELGRRQFEENRSFAEAVVAAGADLVVVGATNRRALSEGARRGGREPVAKVSKREDAVAWVRANLTEGDAVLYENDLPDHFP